MGVSGSGKTTVGEALAQQIGCPFYDGDDFHPPENVAKMSNGIPLNDDDRAPWLDSLAFLMQTHLDKNQSGILACSALKKQYRERLRVDPRVHFIFLDGDFNLIWQRMSSRQDHYMKADMLQSQFSALEPPETDEAIVIDITADIDTVIEETLKTIGVPTNNAWETL
ncbi:MAG: gluconokinase [Chloroflexota bacterium]